MFNPVEFYKLAGDLHKSKTVQSSLRSSISRSYYAAFLVARDKAKIKTTDKSIHTEVEKYYRSKKKLTLANRLADLCTRRGVADYNINENFSDKDSGEALRLSKSILTELGAIDK